MVVTQRRAPGLQEVIASATDAWALTDSGAVSIPGSPPVLDSVTERDSGSDAGGSAFALAGSNLSAVTSVTFNGVAATSLVATATTITGLTPAYAAGAAVTGTQVDIVANNGSGIDTLANAWRYFPAPTTTLFTEDFETGSLTAGWLGTTGGTGSLTIQDDNDAVSGTKIIRCRVTDNSSSSLAYVNLSSGSRIANTFFTNTRGVYMRWWQRVSQSTITNSGLNGQVKIHLCRAAGDPADWLTVGLGPQFQSNNRMDALINGNGYILKDEYGDNNLYPLTADEWLEIQVRYYRDNATSRGFAFFWINGKFYGSQNGFSSLSQNSPPANWNPEFGISFQQSNLNGEKIIDLDDLEIANGFIEP